MPDLWGVAKIKFFSLFDHFLVILIVFFFFFFFQMLNEARYKKLAWNLPENWSKTHIHPCKPYPHLELQYMNTWRDRRLTVLVLIPLSLEIFLSPLHVLEYIYNDKGRSLQGTTEQHSQKKYGSFTIPGNTNLDLRMHQIYIWLCCSWRNIAEGFKFQSYTTVVKLYLK